MKSILKKVLPQNLIQRINEFRISLDDKLSRWCSSSKFTARVYYFFFSKQFDREHFSVLAGRKAYQDSLKKLGTSHPLLRRNTHRLEKGLIMIPRKPIFAESYIEETVNIFALCIHSEQFCKSELKWAFDVLNQYFRVVEHSLIIKQAYQRFLSVPTLPFKDETLSSQLCMPYQSNERANVSVSSEELFQLFKKRRSVRWFQDKKVNLADIEHAVSMAAQAPSACNRQPFSFYTTTDTNIAAEISAIPMGTKGFSENIPALIVVMGDLSVYPKERDRHVIYIDSALASMQLMLALETLGLSTCPINWPDIEHLEQKLSHRLSLAPHQRPIMMIAIGYAKQDGGIPYSQKKSAQQLIKAIE